MEPTATDAVVRTTFNPMLRWYLVLYVAGVLCSTVVGIPLAALWLLGPGQWWARHYFDELLCEVGPETVRFRRGILFTVEKTIPLENIQDVTFVEGPLLRRFHLATLKFETAGNSEGQAHGMSLTGIVGAQDVRQLILERRRALKAAQAHPRPTEAGGEVLLRIAARLDEIALLLRESRVPPGT
jgi:membrane protein YdbS with pleckstrin-like domain